MKKNLILLTVSTSILSGTVFSGTMGSARDWTFVGILSGGAVMQNAGKTQTFYLAPGIEKSYVAGNAANNSFSGEVFVGLQKKLSPTFSGQLGVAIGMANKARLSGVIWDDADPQFDNYTYKYFVDHSQAALKGKLVFDKARWVLPWISAGIGIGKNKAHSFTNTPKIFEALPNNNFTARSENALTYSVGAGVQKAFNQHWQIGLGYEFSAWGKTQLGRAADQTLNSGLGMNILNTNNILVNITYLA